MIIHYLKIAFRALLKHTAFSVINIFGLAIGIACALLVIFHVKDELSYDKGFTKNERIFRVTQEGMGEDIRHWAATPPPLAQSLKEEFPAIEARVRFHRPSPYQVLSYSPLQGSTKRFEEKGGFFADSEVSRVFDLDFIAGDPATALRDKNSIVITESFARKYFGKEDPMGKTLTDDAPNIPMKVTGVIRSYAFPTHLQFDYLLSMSTLSLYQDPETLQRRTWSGFYTYVLLKDAEFKKAVEGDMSKFMVKFYSVTGETPKEILSKRKLHLQPVADIHLHSNLEKEMYPNSDIVYVYIFSLAALFIVLLASVNFINMSTANAFTRMKEIGVRKMIGATKGQLILQFLGESLIMTFLATALSLLLFKVSLPFYNDVAGKNFQFAEVLQLSNIKILGVLIIGIGIMAGLYPAWFIASFNSLSSVKNKAIAGSSVNIVRKGLVIFQFAVAVFMIFSTIIVYRQLQFFHKKDLGFDREQVIALKIYGETRNKVGALENEIKRNPSIVSLSAVSKLPGERFGTQPFHKLNENGLQDRSSARIMWADENLLSTLGISLKDGRNFFNQFPDIKTNEFLLNESAVKHMQLIDPVGKKFIADRDTGIVVGVVKDFNFASLHASVDPLVIQYHPDRTEYLLVKIKAGELQRTLDGLESEMKALSPFAVFNYTFLDEQLGRLYDSENRMSKIFTSFAVFAIFISCLGLFGLSAYAAKLRIKEVGIRKVLGASVMRVALLLSGDFIKLVLVAIVFAWPLAWWAMNKWLEDFAYRIGISMWTFLLSGILVILVALLTVGFHGIKTALANPVESLKTE